MTLHPPAPPVAIDDVAMRNEWRDLHYLTARWNLFGIRRGRLTFARASHEPWPLHQATATAGPEGLMAAAGISSPSHDPIALWSPGVSVDIGHPATL